MPSFASHWVHPKVTAASIRSYAPARRKPAICVRLASLDLEIDHRHFVLLQLCRLRVNPEQLHDGFGWAPAEAALSGGYP
jgi:hypothetical protein